MERRTFLQALPFLPYAAEQTMAELASRFNRYPVASIRQPIIPFPEKKYIPLGLSGFAVDDTGGTLLTFEEGPRRNRDFVLRLTAALDYREEKAVAAYVAGTDDQIGLLDMRFAHPFQPFEASIDAKWAAAVTAKGVELRQTKGEKPAWFLRADSLPVGASGFAPQLLTGKPGKEKQFRDALYSMNSFSPFGWMGGSVIDALYELYLTGDQRASKTLKQHLSYLLDDELGIIFENPVTIPTNGKYNSIEDFLPMRAIVELHPEHVSVQRAVDYCLKHRKRDGMIMNYGDLTTEGCYTTAYPLAAIARQRGDKELAKIALHQLVSRTEHLVTDEAIYQRTNFEDPKTYRNWGRGVAWYLLGTVKTLMILEDTGWELPGLADVKQRWVESVALVEQWASDDKLWYGFLDRPDTLPDASASSGIAASIAWGHRAGYLPGSGRSAGKKTYRSLAKYIRSDGFLDQITQINRGGEALQESGYRVISQFGMGLRTQLGVAIQL